MSYKQSLGKNKILPSTNLDINNVFVLLLHLCEYSWMFALAMYISKSKESVPKKHQRSLQVFLEVGVGSIPFL